MRIIKPFWMPSNLKGFFYASGASQQTRRTVNPFPSGVVGAAPTWRNFWVGMQVVKAGGL